LCKDPLLNEPGVSKTHNDLNNYTSIIEYKNIEIAILRMITKDPRSFPEKFTVFHSYVKENFLKNDKLVLKYLEEKANNEKKPQQIITAMYAMNVLLDYKKLLKSYKEVSLKVLESTLFEQEKEETVA
jgi:hypothetical protein